MKRIKLVFVIMILAEMTFAQNRPDSIPQTIEELKTEIIKIKASCDDIINRHKEAGILYEEAKRNQLIGHIIFAATTLFVFSSDDLNKNFFAGDNSGTIVFYGGAVIDIVFQITAQMKIRSMINKLLYI